MSTTTAPVKDASVTKVVTGIVRFSYAHIWEAKAIEEGQDPKYSVSIIIDKDDTETRTKINKAIAHLEADVKAKNKGKLPNKWKTPLRDGDEERDGDDTYKGAFFLNATSKQAPGIVDKTLNKIIDKDEFYSGCYGRASINFYAFDKAGNRGIACGLNNLQKIKDGEPLSGRSRAEDDFGDGFEGADDLL